MKTKNPAVFLISQIFGSQEICFACHDNVGLFCTKRNSHDHWFEFIDGFLIQLIEYFLC